MTLDDVQRLNFSHAKILVVGDLMVERYWKGDTQRISPEAPVPVVKIQNLQDHAGGAANVAIGLATLGVQTHLLGFVGQDEPAASLSQILERSNVSHDLISSETIPTITKLRVTSGNQQLIRLDFEESYAEDDSLHLLPKFESIVQNFDLVVLSDYAKGTLKECQALIQAAKAHKVPVMVDPKGSDYSKYKGATLVKPNESELRQIVGDWKGIEALTEKVHPLIDELEIDALLLTQSAKGMRLFRSDKETYKHQALAQEVYDVTGAGDTVIAILAAAVASGLELETAVQLGNFGAGVVVGKRGVATVSVEELQQAYFNQDVFQRIFTQHEELAEKIRTAQAQGKKVVFTNGCFDILHSGHTSYMQEAKSLGDLPTCIEF
jgi:D-beta-D-heptose 7-phosphate kinase/D-beta-D-heptose 1-phosphate adenosyltransferase